MGKGMVSQSIWIAIVIGVFFVGIGVSYAIFANTYGGIMMGPGMMMGPNMMMQNWNYHPQTTPSMMMTDPEFRQQMFNQMSVHHQYVLDTMSLTIEDEQIKADFIELMNEHNQLIGGMHTSYLDDPEIQQRIHDHISQHHEFLQKLTGK